MKFSEVLLEIDRGSKSLFFQFKNDFIVDIQKEIEASKARESGADTDIEKEFHKGVQAGMNFVLVTFCNAML